MNTLPDRTGQLFVVSIDGPGILWKLTGLEGWTQRQAPENASCLTLAYFHDSLDAQIEIERGWLMVTVSGQVIYSGAYQEDLRLETFVLVEPVEEEVPALVAA
jgi:hypothetical protein